MMACHFQQPCRRIRSHRRHHTDRPQIEPIHRQDHTHLGCGDQPRDPQRCGLSAHAFTRGQQQRAAGEFKRHTDAHADSYRYWWHATAEHLTRRWLDPCSRWRHRHQRQSGRQHLHQNGTNSHAGCVIFSAGSLQIGDGGSTGTPGNVSIAFNSGTSLIFNRSGPFSTSVSLSGSGSLSHGDSGITGADRRKQ